jgi:uncharacterized protein (UPF0276 family)
VLIERDGDVPEFAALMAERDRALQAIGQPATAAA